MSFGLAMLTNITNTRRSIARDLTISLAIVVTSIAMLIVALNYWIVSRKTQMFIEQKADEYIFQLRDSLALFLWDLDIPNITETANAYIENELVAKLQITEIKNGVIFDKIKGDETEFIERSAEVIHKNRIIGYVEIGLSPRFYKESNRQLLWSSFLIIAVTTITLVCLTGLLLRLLLKKPLADLIQGIEQIASGDYEHRFTKAQKQEIEPIIASFYNMAEQIKGREAAFSELNEELKAEILMRRHAEEEIRRLNAELEQRVTQRTAQLEAANKELEAFLYSVSHDLRAPLRHINGFIQLFLNREEEHVDATSSHYLRNILKSSDKMGHLIDDLLAFSRTGRTAIQTHRVDLDALIRETRQELSSESEGRQITWKIKPLPVVKGDPGLLRQVWVNLLSNAIKYTATRSEARIEIGIKHRDTDEEDEVTIFVRDNGIGFDSNYAHKLFGVFQRLHRAEEFEGTGIGLAIVHRIILRHGGRVWAEGEIDQGATFYFTLKEA